MSIISYQKVENSKGLPPLLWGESWIGVDEVQLFLATFSFFDLLNFEGIGREYSCYTQRRWKQLRAEERFDFIWSDSKVEKSHYIQCKALFSYSAQPQSCFSSVENTQALYARFEGVMLTHPHSIGAYIWDDLISKHAVTSPHAHLFQFPGCEPHTAGDCLLAGLHFLKKERNPAHTNALLNKAICKGATCASLLALNYPLDASSQKKWVILSAVYKDYRALEKLLFEISPKRAKKYFLEGIDHPPVFASYASQLSLKGKFVKADKLWDHALATYKAQAPTATVLDAAHTKFQIQKYHESEVLYDRYCKVQLEKNRDIEPQVWLEMGTTKYFVKKYEEAENLFERSIQVYIDLDLLISPSVWNKLAYTKNSLGKFEEAGMLFEKCLAEHQEQGLSILPNLWANCALMNSKLKQYERAELFFDQALAAYETQNVLMPSGLLLDAAAVKFHLNRKEEGQALEQKARSSLSK